MHYKTTRPVQEQRILTKLKLKLLGNDITVNEPSLNPILRKRVFLEFYHSCAEVIFIQIGSNYFCWYT